MPTRYVNDIFESFLQSRESSGLEETVVGWYLSLKIDKLAYGMNVDREKKRSQD